MRKLDFTGKVQADTARQLIFPGRDDLFLKPDDWPTQLAPGIVSIEISHFPEDLRVNGTDLEASCWAIWIIGSDATKTIQLVAGDDLRSRLNLTDGTAVKVTIWEEESKWKPPTPEEVIADWCEAARGVEDDWGREKAMGYLIGEKFLNFLERAETDRAWRQAIPTFVAGINALFEPWQLAEFLNTPRRLGVLGHTIGEEEVRMLRAEWEEEERIREDARNLMLLEWAKELLLDEEG